MKVPIAIAFGILSSAGAIFAIAWGIAYNWPDYVHTNYGFPFVWGTHTLNTIIGPVDKWSVDVSNLALDLFLWFGTLVCVISIVVTYHRR